MMAPTATAPRNAPPHDLAADRTGRVLVVDHDPLSRDELRSALRGHGHEVSVAPDLLHGIAAFEKFGPDLVVLDLGLPDNGASRLLARVTDTRAVPVLVIGHDNTIDERVDGFECGAVGYFARPVLVRELLACVGAALRLRGRPRVRLEFDGLTVDLATREVRRHDVPVTLAPREFELLSELVLHPNRRYGRDELLRAVWASTSDLQHPSTVNVHIHRVRNKIEDDARRPRWIQTVPGGGYRFVPDGARRGGARSR